MITDCRAIQNLRRGSARDDYSSSLRKTAKWTSIRSQNVFSNCYCARSLFLRDNQRLLSLLIANNELKGYMSETSKIQNKVDIPVDKSIRELYS